MEELLNKLIEKGWKPFGESRIDKINRAEQYVWNWNWCCWGSKDAIQRRKSTRQLVSKESWLWQFVCENGMVDWHKYDSKTYEVRIENWIKRREVWPEWEVSTKEIWRPRHCAEYRLIESALCDEYKLEQFLLNNIKVE